MAFVTLVRHGQANSGARDDTDYDRLSDLGWQQARWLGAHFRAAGDVYARCYRGTLRRHAETLDGIAPDIADPPIVDERLNELADFTMAQAMQDQHGIPIPQGREAFMTHLPRLLTFWRDGRLDGVPESFAAFEARVSDALEEIAAGDGRALVVTSGGLIGMAMRQALGLDLPAMALLCLAIENSSVHRVQPMAGQLAVTQFNALPHLDTPSRGHARSHI